MQNVGCREEFDSDDKRAVAESHADEIFHKDSGSETPNGRNRVGNFVAARHVKTKHYVAKSGGDCASQGVHSVGVGEDVDEQPDGKRDCHKPVDVYVDWQSEEHVDKYERRRHVE